jgi:hypothetical protein
LAGFFEELEAGAVLDPGALVGEEEHGEECLSAECFSA